MARITTQAAKAWARFVSRGSYIVLVAALLLAAGGITLAVTKMGFIADRNALISRDLDWNQRFLGWWERFPGVYDLVVVVDSHSDTDPKGLERAKAYLDELGPKLNDHPLVERADWGAPVADFSPRTALLLPPDDFQEQVAQAGEAADLLRSPTPGDLIDRTTARLRQGGGNDADEAEAAARIQRMTTLIDSLGEAIRTGEGRPLEWLSDPGDGPEWEYLVSANRRLLFMRVTPRLEEGAINALEESVLAVRRAMAEVAKRHPGIDAGLTGNEVVETDETIAITRDATLASILALLGVTVLLISALGGVRVPLMAVTALLIGVAWSFGFLVLTVGHLQLLSVFFIAILLGLGIDFGIHLSAAMERVRPDHQPGLDGFEESLGGAFRLSAPGIITGAVTTAAAFGVMVFGDFSGVSEMGLIALGGILLCLLAMLTVFPAIWRIFSINQPDRPITTRTTIPGRIVGWMGRSAQAPAAVLIAAGVISLVALIPVSQLRFDYDLMAIQPRAIESIQWQERISEDGGQSIWFAVSIGDDLEELERRARRFAALEEVAEVLGIGLLWHPHADGNRQWLEEAEPEIRELAEDAQRESAPGGEVMATAGGLDHRLASLAGMLRLAGDGRVPETLRSSLDDLRQSIDRTRTAIDELPADARPGRLVQLTRSYRAQRAAVAARVEQLVDGRPLTLEDFPESLFRPYVDADGPGPVRYALEIHPRLPRGDGIASPLSPRFLPGFVQALREIDSKVTGVIFQVYEFGHLMQRAYIQAGIMALAAVFIIVWISFRRLTDALMCMLPVSLGFLWMFAVVVLSGVTLNPANITVLPLMFGIGVDAAVHVLHRYGQHPQTRPLGLALGTGKGITLTSLTTMIGFAAMMIADHRGIFSLGFVLTVGMGMTLLICLTVMPSLLELRTRRRIRCGLLTDTPEAPDAPEGAPPDTGQAQARAAVDAQGSAG
ncbi:MAG: MMPL family transporter [Phycisphaeraceae bacterium]|nr:MMPL family transporter [Phycisphaeraceae bacterium]